MSASLSPSEVQFLRSLRLAMAKAGSSARLVSSAEPIADPAKPAVAPAEVVEPRRGYWLQNATFSRVRTGAYPQAAGVESLLECNDMPGPPRGRGISLTRREYRLNPASTNLNFYIYAQIQFGIGGSLTTVLVDWSNGIINVPASSVRVNAMFTALDTQGGAYPYRVGTPPEIGGDLGAMVCTDPLVSKGYNTYTQLISAPGADLVSVPQFAIGFWMAYPASTALTGGTQYVRMYTSTVYNGIPGPTIIGDIPSQQIINNGISTLNAIPSNCQQLDFSFSGLPSGTLGDRKAIIWALAI